MAKICGIIGKTTKKEIDTLASPMEKYRNFKKEYIFGDNYGICRLYLENEGKDIFENNKYAVIFLGYLLDLKNKKKYSEGLLDLFINKGRDFVKNLNGIFNIIIIDKLNNTIYIFNDRYGINNLYYYYGKEKLIFASEVKGVIRNKHVPREIDWNAWCDYFSFRYILGEKTFFKNVKSIPNASILTYSKNIILINKYWDYTKIKVNNKKSLNEFIDEGKKLIKRCILRSSNGIKNPICFLSGGNDSRCLASALKTYTDLKFESFTTEHPSGKDDPIIAKIVAKKLKIKNTFVKHPPNLYQKYYIKKFYLTDGMVQEHLWSLPMNDFLSQKNGVIFDGLAGDLFLKGLFLDKNNLNAIKNLNNLSTVLNDQYGYSTHILKKFFSKQIYNKISHFQLDLTKELFNLKNSKNIISIFFAKNRTKNALSSMANNIFSNFEKRYPFLENDLVTFALSIPSEMKVKDHIYIRILKQSFPNIMQIPTSNSRSLISRIDLLVAGILTKFKMQRTTKTYFKNLLFKKTLSNDELNFFFLLGQSLKIPDFINKNIFYSHLTRKHFDFSTFLIIEFLLWYKMFINEN